LNTFAHNVSRTIRGVRPAALRRLPMAILLGAALTGCAVVPEPIDAGTRNARAKSDVDTLFKDVEPVTGALTLHEAFARALKYNYDYRLRSMEQSMASSQLDLAKYDMLPRLTVAAGYSARSNDAGSRSVDLGTGVESNLFSGAQERRRDTQNAVLAWNVLDFGVSYVRAQQQAVQVLIADERKRKVVQNISQDVRQAFWRAYVAQQTLPRMDDLLNRVREALLRSERMESERMLPPLQALSYQRALLDLHQQIVARRQELILAKSELNALINLRPGTVITLSAGQEEEATAKLQPFDDLNALDTAALNNRPELREEDYRKKISVLEGRKALLAFLPGLEINLSGNRDSNKYLLNNTWGEAGSSVSLNLMRAFAYPATKRAQDVQAQLDDTRRVALTMAVLTQVRIATQRFQEARADYAVSSQAAKVDARIEQHTLSATKASAESEMELLRTEVRASLSEMQRYVALANLQSAYARVANSVGADLLPEQPQSESVAAFTAQLAKADQDWRKTSFHTADVALPPPQVALGVIAAPAGSNIDLAALLRKQLGEHGAQVSDAPGAPVVSAVATVGQPTAGMRSVEVTWQVKRGASVLATIPYRSAIPDSVGSAWPVFGQAAAESAAAKITSLLRAEASASRQVKN
jgi:outer membrane protein TolC